jgi:hypothetical protein
VTIRLAAAGTALAVLALAACGSDDSAAPRIERPAIRYGGPEDAALRYVRRVGDGDIGFAMAVYHPAVVREMGLERLGRSVGLSRGRLGGVEASIRATRPVADARRGTVLVVVEATRGEGRPDGMSFVVVPDGRRWRIAYDTFTRDSLETYARVRRERRPFRLGGELERAGARAAGLPAGEEFRR